MSLIYRWQQVVTYKIEMLDVGDIDEETGEVAYSTEAEARESAEQWQRSAMPIEYYPEDFVIVTEGPVEFLGLKRR